MNPLFSTETLSSTLIEQIERHTLLKRCGRELLGHCQLHDDRHPSMRVNPDKGVWFCTVCNITRIPAGVGGLAGIEGKRDETRYDDF